MKDMIAEIVNMDQKAREMTAEAQRSKVNVQQEINELRKKIREEYLTRARKRMELNKKTEKKAAADAWKSIRAKQLRISKKLNSTYAKNGSMWIDTIVKRVIGE